MSASFVKVLLLASFAPSVDGHGAMLRPLSRNAVDRYLPEFTGGKWPTTTDGCNCANRQGNCSAATSRTSMGGQPCMWFSQGCTIGCSSCDGNTQHTFGKSLCNTTMKPTINDPSLRTMNRGAKAGSPQDYYRYNPWRAPGSAPVVDACGIAGGAPHAGGGAAVFAETQFAKQGDLGSQVLHPLPSGTVWYTASIVEVSWGIRYNHGGGYSYRLCPLGDNLTEACFQQTPLAFTGMPSFRWNDGKELYFKGTYITKGTTPAGSMWAMNPIPRIDDGSSGQPGIKCGSGAVGAACRQFDPQCEEIGNPPWHRIEPTSRHGDVEGLCSGDWTGGEIVDRVIIPAGLPAGEYVLGWRWDCEETAQVWASCADVTIKRNESLIV